MQPENNQLSMAILMTPDIASFSGNIHDDTLLKYLDEVTYAYASRCIGRYAVTLSVDQVIFRESMYVDGLVTFLASVNCTGRTSMEIDVKVIAENIREQSVRHTGSCFFTMVALDDECKPMAIRPPELEAAEQRRRFAQAQQCRQLRAGLEARYQVIREGG